jgi:hypothetical protein
MTPPLTPLAELLLTGSVVLIALLCVLVLW